MTMPLSLARRISSGRVTLEDLREEAERTLGARSEKRKRTAPKRKAGVEKKRALREERNARMSAIRADVYNQSGGNCAAKCGTPIAPATFHAHHVLGGGLRRFRESVDTVAPLCGPCHDAIHRGDLDVLLNLLLWATDTGRRIAAAALTTRIAKVNESRRPSPPASPQETP